MTQAKRFCWVANHPLPEARQALTDSIFRCRSQPSGNLKHPSTTRPDNGLKPPLLTARWSFNRATARAVYATAVLNRSSSAVWLLAFYPPKTGYT